MLIKVYGVIYCKGVFMGKYKTILFDADGTLFDFDKAETFAFEVALKENSLPCNNEILTEYKRINDSLWALLEQGKVTQAQIRINRFETLHERFDFAGNPSDTADSFIKFLSRGAFFLDGAVEILEYLHKKYTLYIVTNGITKVQKSRYALSKLDRYFSAMFISEEIGVSKPDVGYFNVVFDKIALFNKEKAIIIGDSLTSDIRGGNNAGIDTCWYNPSGKQNDKGVQCTHEIAHLIELKNLL